MDIPPGLSPAAQVIWILIGAGALKILERMWATFSRLIGRPGGADLIPYLERQIAELQESRRNAYSRLQETEDRYQRELQASENRCRADMDELRHAFEEHRTLQGREILALSMEVAALRERVRIEEERGRRAPKPVAGVPE
jgi:hypothetical protein